MNKVSVIQGQISQNKANFAVLRSGSVVTGRVLSKNADGSYLVSIAGQKISVKSEANLRSGQVFSARVKIAGNQVALSLVQESKSSGEILQKISGSNQNLSPEVQNFLMSLGFEPDADSFKILQFMQQLGMKIDVPAAKKALNSSRNGGNVSEEKAQVSLLLEEKGIPPDEEKVSSILGKNQENSQNSNHRKKKDDEAVLALLGNKISGEKKYDCCKKSVQNFFEAVDEAALCRENGVLSAFNTVLSSSRQNAPLRHWILLPFEWNFKNYYGSIRLLFDSELKNLEKSVIDLKNSSHKNIFVLNFTRNSLDSVRFASDFAITGSDKNQLEKMLSAAFKKDVPVEIETLDKLTGFCSDDEVFSMVKGDA